MRVCMCYHISCVEKCRSNNVNVDCSESIWHGTSMACDWLGGGAQHRNGHGKSVGVGYKRSWTSARGLHIVVTPHSYRKLAEDYQHPRRRRHSRRNRPTQTPLTERRASTTGDSHRQETLLHSTTSARSVTFHNYNTLAPRAVLA